MSEHIGAESKHQAPPEPDDKVKDPASEPVEVWRLASIGTHFLMCMLIGYFAGDWIDGKFDTKPMWGSILGFLGIVAGFVNLFRELAIVNRAEEELKRQQEARDEAGHEHNGTP